MKRRGEENEVKKYTRERDGERTGKGREGGGVEERRRGEEKGKERKVWERKGKGKRKDRGDRIPGGFLPQICFRIQSCRDPSLLLHYDSSGGYHFIFI